jgi:hypothetical protein
MPVDIVVAAGASDPGGYRIGDVVTRKGARPHGDPPWLPAEGLIVDVGDPGGPRPYLVYFAGGREMAASADQLERVGAERARGVGDSGEWVPGLADLLVREVIADSVNIEVYTAGGLGPDPDLVARRDRLAAALDAFERVPAGFTLDVQRPIIDAKVRERHARVFPVRSRDGTILIGPAVAYVVLVHALACPEGALCAWLGGLTPDTLRELLQPEVIAHAARLASTSGQGAAPPSALAPGSAPLVPLTSPTAAQVAAEDFPPIGQGPAAQPGTSIAPTTPFGPYRPPPGSGRGAAP